MSAFRKTITLGIASALLATNMLSANAMTLRTGSVISAAQPTEIQSLTQEVRHRKWRKHRKWRRDRHRHYHDDFWPGLIGGLIIGGVIVNASQWQAHQNWCYRHYRSYHGPSNTFQPYHGPRRTCRSPYWR